MNDCIFCKIAGGEIPSITLFEDDKVRVIFDAGPATVGHALVIPKSHAANVFEIDDELLAHAHIVAKKVATALKEATGCEGVNILQNNGEIAGQSVFHLHVPGASIGNARDQETMETYRARKAKRRKSPAGMLFAGLVWLALATVLLILFEVSA